MEVFKLYNPTYSNSVTGDVRYADQMDFDHSGEYLMYDAFNEISKSTGGEYTYWDIGFLHVFDKSKNTFGTGKIEKLIASLPENTSVGNPVFQRIAWMWSPLIILSPVCFLLIMPCWELTLRNLKLMS